MLKLVLIKVSTGSSEPIGGEYVCGRTGIYLFFFDKMLVCQLMANDAESSGQSMNKKCFP